MILRHLLPLGAAFVVFLLPSPAQAKTCYSSESASMQVHHVRCRTAVKVVSRATRHLRRGQHHFAVHVAGRRWGCDFANVGGYGTLTCERGFGTPKRQYIIFVSE
ncbi:MAG: hypothetical protein WB819_21425 [Terriglobia bacterium]